MSRLVSRKVLMVEDDERIRDSMRLFFEAKGYRFKAVESAESGLKELALLNYDIIISDYKLPDMDGLEFLKAIQETHLKALKIFTTAYGNEYLFSRAKEVGTECCIEKPLTAEKVEACLTKLKSRDGISREYK